MGFIHTIRSDNWHDQAIDNVVDGPHVALPTVVVVVRSDGYPVATVHVLLVPYKQKYFLAHLKTVYFKFSSVLGLHIQSSHTPDDGIDDAQSSDELVDTGLVDVHEDDPVDIHADCKIILKQRYPQICVENSSR